MQSQKLAIITILAALVLTIPALSTINPYNVFAKSNAQSSTAANDCPAWLKADNFISAVQEQANTNCLIDSNMVQDSDGTAIASVPSNTGPSQDQKIKLNIDVDIDRTTPIPPGVGCPDDYVWDLTLDGPLPSGPAGDTTLPTGTVLCSFNGIGSQTVQIEDTGVELPVSINLPDGDFCESDTRAHASSGTPPGQLEIGDLVCVEDLRDDDD
jgi:hypothetical protein